MPVRRRSWVMCRLSMRLPHRSSSSKMTCTKPAVVLSGHCHAAGWGAPRRPYRPAVGDNVAGQERSYAWVFYALEMLPVWCSTCASGPGMITTVSVSPSHLTT